MSLIDVPFEMISEQALNRLIENQVPEDSHQDYKLKLPGNLDDDKKEFLKDITALANFQGGHVVFGMEEVNALPTRLDGVEGDIDEQVLRIDNMLRDGIQPRIVGIRIARVALSNGRTAVVIRIPQSLAGPHRVSFRGWNKFFLRNSAGSHEVSVDELRAMFMGGVSNRDRVREFCRERVGLIADNRGPVVLRGGGRAILHIVPLIERDEAVAIDLSEITRTLDFAPIGSGNYSFAYNIDGAILTRPNVQNGYVQIFRNGSIEATATEIIGQGDDADVINTDALAQKIVRSLYSYLTGLKNRLDVLPPLAISICLQGVRNCMVNVGEEEPHRLYTDDVWLPLMVLHDSVSSHQQLVKAIHPALDALWNAGGAPGCPY